MKEMVTEHIRKDLDIQIDNNEIIYAYRMRKNTNTIPPIIVSFANNAIKNRVLHKAKDTKKKSSTYPNSEIFVKARTPLRNNKIQASWRFKGEVFIWKEVSSKAIKITCRNELLTYSK